MLKNRNSVKNSVLRLFCGGKKQGGKFILEILFQKKMEVKISGFLILSYFFKYLNLS